MVTIDFVLMATVLGVLGTLGGLAAGVVKIFQSVVADITKESDRPAVRGWWERGVQGGAKLPPPIGEHRNVPKEHFGAKKRERPMGAPGRCRDM